MTGLTCTTFASWHGPAQEGDFTVVPHVINELGVAGEHNRNLSMGLYQVFDKSRTNPILKARKDRQVLIDGNCFGRLY